MHCYSRYLDNSMPVILQQWRQIQRTSSSLRHLNCGPGHIQCSFSSECSGFNIQLNVTELLFEISRQFNARYNANLLPNTAHVLQFTVCELRSRDIQCNYSSAYSGFNIQMNVSALILEIYRQFNVGYTATLVPIQRTTSSLRSVNCGPGHIHCKYSSAYSGFNIQLNVSAWILEISGQFNACNTASLVPNTAHILPITLCKLWSRPYTV
jgi:hypothetical protein